MPVINITHIVAFGLGFAACAAMFLAEQLTRNVRVAFHASKWRGPGKPPLEPRPATPHLVAYFDPIAGGFGPIKPEPIDEIDGHDVIRSEG